jgi:uroporphyrinogen-III decarboxylase
MPAKTDRMTPRERLFHSLKGEPVDQTAVWLLFPYHPTGYYVAVRNHKGYRRVHDYSRERGVMMLNRRGLGVRQHRADVLYAHNEVGAAGRKIIQQTICHGGVCLCSESHGGKKLLASDEDLEAYCSLPLEEDEGILIRKLNDQLGQYMTERNEFPIECGAMMLDLGSPINTIYHAADLGTYPIWSLTHSKMIEDWLARRMRQLETVYRYCLDHELADVYFLVGSELASPPMVSRETFQRWVVPYERRLISLIHSYGKMVIQHYHGQIREILPDFLEMGPDGLHTIESPPVGNCTLSQAFEVTQEKITLIGNIQYDEFRSSTPAQMKERVRATLDEVAGRRFILSPTAGPFDESPPDLLIENYIAFIDAALEYC